MYEDFKEKVILVMQHPIMNRSPHDLTDEEKAQAYDLLMNLPICRLMMNIPNRIMFN